MEPRRLIEEWKERKSPFLLLSQEFLDFAIVSSICFLKFWGKLENLSTVDGAVRFLFWDYGTIKYLGSPGNPLLPPQSQSASPRC